MKLSKLASEIAESPTFALNEEARLLRERGEAVINLGNRRAQEQDADLGRPCLRCQADQRGSEIHAA